MSDAIETTTPQPEKPASEGLSPAGQSSMRGPEPTTPPVAAAPPEKAAPVEQNAQAASPAVTDGGAQPGEVSEAEKNEMVNAANEQIKQDYGAYMAPNAKQLDTDKVQVRPSSEFGPGVMGGYNWTTDETKLNQESGANQETILHEDLHKTSNDGEKLNEDGKIVHMSGIEEQTLDPQTGSVEKIKNRALNEGITESLTVQSAKNMGLENISPAYQGEQEVAQALGSKVGPETLKTAYFNNDSEGLKLAIDSQCGSGAFDQISKRLDVGDKYGALFILKNGLPA